MGGGCSSTACASVRNGATPAGARDRGGVGGAASPVQAAIAAECRAGVKRGRASELLQRAEGYAKGDQGDAMVRGLAQKVGALLLGV